MAAGTRAPAATPPLLDVVIVSLKTGVDIRGVLRERSDDGFVLAAAQQAMTGPNGQVGWQRLDGEVVIPMVNIDYFQRALPAALLTGMEVPS